MGDAFCEYGHRYNTEFFSFEITHYYPIEMLRFRIYVETLKSLHGAVRNILMVDLRDVLFQGDPFSAENMPQSKKEVLRPGVPLPYVTFTEEGENEHPLLIEDQWLNYNWVRTSWLILTLTNPA